MHRSTVQKAGGWLKLSLDVFIYCCVGVLQKQNPKVLVQDNLLQALVEEIDDLMKRLGISPELVLGVSGLGLRKVELQVKDARKKVEEGGEFLVRGIRLFGSDLTNTAQLFYRAVLGEV